MSKEELDCLQMQLKVLKSVETEYGNRSIGNVIENIKSRINYAKEQWISVPSWLYASYEYADLRLLSLGQRMQGVLQ